MSKNTKIESKRQRIRNVEKKAIKLRKEVNRLYYKEGISKIQISKKKHVSNNFVIRWTEKEDQDFTVDNRGWQKGKRRKWNKETEEKIKTIHNYLTNNPNEFFTGATAVMQEWRRRYPESGSPPLRTIGKILSDLGLSGSRRTTKNKGASRYLCYPEYTIYNSLGGRVLEADFIRKNMKKQTRPLHFIGFCFKTRPKLRYYKRIEAETSREIRKACDSFFKEYERPDYIKVDNAAAMLGSAYTKNKRNLSNFMKEMLDKGVNPIFSVPRRPFSQASIEGNNSVFSRKFWNKRWFEDITEVDRQLEWFNNASIRYTGYKKPEEDTKRKKFSPKVYFIRQVREGMREKSGYINVLNDDIELEQSYINYFVLAEWDLIKERLYIRGYMPYESRPPWWLKKWENMIEIKETKKGNKMEKKN